jgi:hypothetical protein
LAADADEDKVVDPDPDPDVLDVVDVDESDGWGHDVVVSVP